MTPHITHVLLIIGFKTFPIPFEHLSAVRLLGFVLPQSANGPHLRMLLYEMLEIRKNARVHPSLNTVTTQFCA